MCLDIFADVFWEHYDTTDGYITKTWLPCDLTGNYHLVSIDTNTIAYFEVNFTYYTYEYCVDMLGMLDKIMGAKGTTRQVAHTETMWFDENNIRVRVVERRKFNVGDVFK